MKKSYVVIMVTSAFCCLRGHADVVNSISVRDEIRYPTEYEVLAQEVTGRTHVVSVPSGFETRHVGTHLEGHAHAVRHRRDDITRRTFLHLPNGKRIAVKQGDVVRIKGHLYRVMGWRGNTFRLMGNNKIIDFESKK